MARKFVVPLGLLASSNDPTGHNAGDMYFNTVANSIKTYNGSEWSFIGSAANMDGGIPSDTYSVEFDGGTP